MWVSLTLIPFSLAVGQTPTETVVSSTPLTAFINVNVLPMDVERVLGFQTVIVEGDRIATIGPADETTVPPDAEVIEGAGAYLMPGLADMHTHLSLDTDPKHLEIYLAAGVTTIRNLNAIPEHLAWRDQVANGERLGPTVYTSGPTIVGLPPDFRSMRYTFWGILTLSPVVIGILLWLILWLFSKLEQVKRLILPSLAGLLLLGIVVAWLRVIPLNAYISLTVPFASVVESERQARKFVSDQQAAGVDFIKPYDYLTRAHYFAVMDETERRGIYTAGHIPDQPEIVSVRDMIDAGQDEVVHVDEFTHEFWIHYDPGASELDWVEYDIDMGRIDEVAALIAENAVAVTTTLVTNEIVLLGLEDSEALLQQPEYSVIRSETLAEWKSRGRFVNWKGQEAYRRDAWRPLLMQLTRALHEHGALLALGTDVSVEGIVPGFSVHQELELLVEAGLTPFEALATGTRNAAQITGRMGAEGNWGTIQEGNQADLILLLRNPLDDVTHTQDRVGIMVRGQWFTQVELDQMVSDFTATY